MRSSGKDIVRLVEIGLAVLVGTRFLLAGDVADTRT